jgi:hypothetical protein
MYSPRTRSVSIAAPCRSAAVFVPNALDRSRPSGSTHPANHRFPRPHAVALAQQAITESGPDRSRRSRTFDRIILSTNLLRTNELEAGVDVARDVISEAQVLRSGRGLSRLVEIGAAASHHSDSSDAVDLLHQLESVRTTAPKALTA